MWRPMWRPCAAVVLGLGLAWALPPGRPHTHEIQWTVQSPDQPELLIVSAGGVGTSDLMHELRTLPQLAAVMNKENGLKHAPLTRQVLQHSTEITNVRRILYLWGEPTHAAESCYRRGFAAMQAVKTRTDPLADGTFKPPNWDSEYVAKGVPKTIEDYAAAEGDVFQFYEHLASYLHPGKDLLANLTALLIDGSPPELAFLQMEHKTEHLDQLASFLGIFGDVTANLLNSTLTPWDSQRPDDHSPVHDAIDAKFKALRQMTASIPGGGFHNFGAMKAVSRREQPTY